jgi:hypothetical protein
MIHDNEFVNFHAPRTSSAVGLPNPSGALLPLSRLFSNAQVTNPHLFIS